MFLDTLFFKILRIKCLLCECSFVCEREKEKERKVDKQPNILLGK